MKWRREALVGDVERGGVAEEGGRCIMVQATRKEGKRAGESSRCFRKEEEKEMTGSKRYSPFPTSSLHVSGGDWDFLGYVCVLSCGEHQTFIKGRLFIQFMAGNRNTQSYHDKEVGPQRIERTKETG